MSYNICNAVTSYNVIKYITVEIYKVVHVGIKDMELPLLMVIIAERTTAAETQITKIETKTTIERTALIGPR